jgi:hypothetical protein
VQRLGQESKTERSAQKAPSCDKGSLHQAHRPAEEHALTVYKREQDEGHSPCAAEMQRPPKGQNWHWGASAQAAGASCSHGARHAVSGATHELESLQKVHMPAERHEARSSVSHDVAHTARLAVQYWRKGQKLQRGAARQTASLSEEHGSHESPALAGIHRPVAEQYWQTALATHAAGRKAAQSIGRHDTAMERHSAVSAQ